MVGGALRILDVDLAARLGFERPRDIRKLVERWRGELEKLGGVRHRGAGDAGDACCISDGVCVRVRPRAYTALNVETVTSVTAITGRR
jgi:hypothetical protein